MSNLKFLEKISEILNKVSKILLCVFMAVMCIDVLFGVLNRFVFKFPVAWTDEIARYLMIWITMLGSSIALKVGAHIGFSYVFERLGKAKKAAFVLGNLMSIFFLSIGSVYGFALCSSQMSQISPALRISMSIPYSAIPIGCSIMIFHLSLSTLQSFKNTAD